MIESKMKETTCNLLVHSVKEIDLSFFHADMTNNGTPTILSDTYQNI